MNFKRIFVILIIMLFSMSYSYSSMADELPFQDFSNIYPDEHEGLYYLLYIDGVPFDSPYMALQIPEDNKEQVYYFPGRDLLNALGVEGTYDKKLQKLLIHGKEFPTERVVLGRDMETGEKIIYLPFRELLDFLALPQRIQENGLGTSIYVKTDGLSAALPVNDGLDKPEVITWYPSIGAGQAVAQSQGKRILVKFGAQW